MRRLFALSAGFLAAFAGSAFATEFANSYLRFELPAGWACLTEETEFVCNPPHVDGEKVSAVMILTAKIQGSDDSLGAYRRHLETRGAELGRHGVVRPPSNIKIGDVIWVDSTLRGSEISNYITRYLATVKNGIAILYTFSCHEKIQQEMEGSALLALSTLQVKDALGSRR